MNAIKRATQAVKSFLGMSGSSSMVIGNQNLIPFLFGGSGNEAYNNKIFYAAQNILVKKLTEAPIMFAKKKPGNGSKMKKFYDPETKNEARAFIKALSISEMEDHPLNKLFDSPNSYQSGIEMMEDFWYNYGLGDGFFFFETLGELSRIKLPVAIHSLNRDRCTPVKSFDRFNPISHYRYVALNGDIFDIPKENVLHLKRWNPAYGDLKGLGVNIPASRDIALSNANNEAQGTAFRNGGKGVIFSSKVHVDGEGQLVYKLTDDQVKAMKATVKHDYQGIENYRKQHFSNGEVEVQEFGDTLAEMEMVDSEKSNWKNIFAVCGVPWALAPISDNATENNVKAGFKSLVTNTVLPEVKKLDQKLTQKIAQWWPDTIAVTDVTEYSELTPDLKLMKETYGSPMMRVDEVRAVFSLDSLGGDVGNAIMIPSGFSNLEDLLNMEEIDVTTGLNPDEL